MTIKTRLKRLEDKRKQSDQGPPYISIKEGDPIPEGYKGKVYINCSPDDWSDPESEETDK